MKKENSLEKLMVSELEIGEKFIAFPVPGDNKGHGGYKGTHYIFEKISDATYKRCKDGIIDHLPILMPIIKVE